MTILAVRNGPASGAPGRCLLRPGFFGTSSFSGHFVICTPCLQGSLYCAAYGLGVCRSHHMLHGKALVGSFCVCWRCPGSLSNLALDCMKIVQFRPQLCPSETVSAPGVEFPMR